MSSQMGHDILKVYDVWHEARDILTGLVDSPREPEDERAKIFGDRLLDGTIDCRSLILGRQSIHCVQNWSGLDHVNNGMGLLLSHAAQVCEGVDGSITSKPWAETDQQLVKVTQLELDAQLLYETIQQRCQRLHCPGIDTESKGRVLVNTKRRPTKASRFWEEQAAVPSFSSKHGKAADVFLQGRYALSALTSRVSNPASRDAVAVKKSSKEICHLSCRDAKTGKTAHCCTRTYSAAKLTSNISPYFTPLSNEATKAFAKKPPAGTVSCIPFPPLDAPRFGIVQELVAHEPFWLLIAVTFLIKTSGHLAIPTFYKVKERFPAASDIANPANAKELLEIIRHLGLSAVRLRRLQKYAQAFLNQPPRPGVWYKVKNYDSRDVFIPSAHRLDVDLGRPMADSGFSGQTFDADAWEIGHMTQGKYALDSWRIFCRDKLLRRACDWTGTDREGEFQPEWMRVLPADKELRAYLRWMWMREGWEWEPSTGERTVLRDEMRRAVNGGRVEYDDAGGLRILAVSDAL